MITNTGAKYYKVLHEKNSWSGYSEKQVKRYTAT